MTMKESVDEVFFGLKLKSTVTFPPMTLMKRQN